MGKDGSMSSVRVHVAAFGKHPGWDDHIEEIGLDCDALVRAKRVLYAEGIAGNIDSGSWERLGEGQALPGFRHAFYWRLPEGLLVGRMWASKDGKGRSKYPMCVCGLVEGMPAAWSIATIMPLLEQIEGKVTQTNAAELVRLSIGEARRALEERAAVAFADGASTDTGADAALLARLLTDPTMTGGDSATSGVTRVMYEVDREMAAFRPPTGSMRLSRSVAESPPAQHLRVPRVLKEGGEGVLGWLTLLGQELSDAAPILVFEALGQSYLDIIVGEPKPPQLFCIRATPKGLALTSDVPYTIDATFAAGVESRVKDWREGKLRRTRAATKGAPSGGATGDPGVRSGGKKGLLIGAGVVAVVAVVVLFVLSRGGGSDEPSPAPGPYGSGSNAVKPDETPRIVPKPPPSTISDVGSGDPRAGWGFEALVSRTREMLAILEREAAEEGRTVDPALRQRVDRAADKEEKFIRTATFNPSGRDRLIADMRGVEGEVATVAGEAEALLAETYGRIRAFTEGVAASPKVSAPPMRAAWAAGMRGIDPSKGWKAARARVEALSAALVQAESGLTSLSAGPIPTLSEANMGVVNQVFESKREDAIRSAADGVVAGDAGKTEEARTSLQSWARGASGLLDKAARVEGMLARGLRADEPDEAGVTITAALADMRADPAWKDLGVALGPLATRCDRLAKLSGEQNHAALLAAIREAKGELSRVRASEVVTAWRLLDGTGWPGTAEELAIAAKVLPEEVRAVLGRLEDADRRAALTREATRTGAQMWSRWAKSSLTDEAMIRAGMAAMAPLGAGEAELAGLPTWAKYNLARHAFAQAVEAAAGKSGAARDAAQRAAMDEFVAKVQGLDVATGGAPAALLAALEPLRGRGAELDLGKLGPGAAGWIMEDGTAGDRVAYTLRHGGNTHRVEFRRIEPASGDDVSFLATTEVSVGQFAGAIDAAGKWAEFKTALPSSDTGGLDMRRGPRAWVWNDGKIVPSPIGDGDTSAGWLRGSPSMAGKAYYPEGMKIDPPTWDSPMQQVSARAAMLMARLAGCRLPTPGEWKTAQGGGVGATNRRDATWKRAFDHIKALDASDREYPSSNVFRPAGRPIPPITDDKPAVEGDDGVLWFQGALGGESQGEFRNLIGNVAEIVFEDAGAMDAVPATLADIEKLIGRGEKVRVIGASALSPGEIKPEEAIAVSGTQVGGWWSDVGFRLAFSAPREAGAAGAGDRIKSALASNGYLSGKQ